MTRLFLCGLVVLVVIAGISPSSRHVKGDGIYFSMVDHRMPLRRGSKALHLQDLGSYGNFGLGRPEGSGGAIILDGVVYSIRNNGSAFRMKRNMHLPFAALKFFRADKRVKMKQPLTLPELESYLDSLLLPGESAAVKIQGRFARMQYRNFTGDSAITDIQRAKFFERHSIQGAMVGFYAPGKTSVLQGDGYHFHFIDRNRTTGGVVVDCLVKEVYIEIDYANTPRFSVTDTVDAITYPLARVYSADLTK